MPKFLVNLSAEQEAKIGKCSTAAELQTAFDALVTASGAPVTEQKVMLFSDVENLFKAQIGTFNASVTALTEKFTATETAVAAVNPVTLKASCVEAAQATASTTAAKVLGKLGASGADVVNADVNDGTEAKTGSAALIAEGKFKEAYAADAKIRQEFSSAESYDGYMKASTKGRVQISGKN